MSEFSKYEAAKMLVRLERIHANLLSDIVQPLGLYTGQHRILMYLADRGEKYPSQKDIAETFDISAAAVAASLRKLSNSGYIKKKSLNNDNRVNNVSLTEKGLEATKCTMDEVKRVSESLFNALDDKELSVFCNCMLKIESAIMNYSK